MDFRLLLQQAGLSRTDLALDLGVKLDTIYKWRRNPPEYALAYLRVVIQLNAYKELNR
jgi:DNA-binding transcriptional regulator YiaG